MKFANFTKWLYNKTHKVKISDYEAKIDSLRRLVDAGEVEMKIIQSRYNEEVIKLKTKILYYPKCDPQATFAILAQEFGEHLFYNKYVDIKTEDSPFDNGKIVTMSLSILKKGDRKE